MALDNKLHITDSTELARMEEKISKKKAIELFENEHLKNNIHVIISKNDERLSEYVKLHTEYRIRHYSSKASTFGCCSKFEQCSDAKKCIHENRLYLMADVLTGHIWMQGKYFTVRTEI